MTSESRDDSACREAAKKAKPERLPKMKFRVRMVTKALKALKDPAGCTETAIWKYLRRRFKLAFTHRKMLCTKVYDERRTFAEFTQFSKS
eukprot:3985856-Pyramimonas_sp.AAC.1